MTRLRRWLKSDTVLLIMGLILVVIFAVFQPSADTDDQPGRALSVRNDRPPGALALRLWLEEMGYRVREMTAEPFDLDDLDVLMILEPAYPYSTDEAYRVYNWVQRGHTLIVAGSPGITDSLLAPYQVRLARYGTAPDGVVVPISPALSAPPVDRVVSGESVVTIQSSRADMVVHFVASDNEPCLAWVPAGSGSVWVVGMVRPFTNIGLQDENGGRLILNLLADVPAGSRVGFDEALHLSSSESEGLTAWLFSTRPGWSIIAAAVLTFVFLLLRGRRFARAVPVVQDQFRREPVEYILAMANLNRRSGQRAAMLNHYRVELRRTFVRRYALDPNVSDSELVRIVTTNAPATDGAALAQLLQQLAQKTVSEQDLVRLAMQVDEWIGDRH